MFDPVLIENCISEYFKEGNERFAIYPCGENGKLTSKVLKRSFGLEPIYCIDNILAKESINYITIDKVFYNRNDFIYIILTVENDELNKLMYKELVERFPNYNIINLLEYRAICKKNYFKDVSDRVDIKNIIPNYKKKIRFRETKNKRIKVRFLFSRKQCFNSISSVCKEFHLDKRYEMKLIIGWDQRRSCVETAKKNGYDYVLWQEYDVKSDDPDVLILSQAYDYTTQLRQIRNHCKLILVIASHLIRNTSSLNEFWSVQRKSFQRFQPDYYICDSLLYHEIKESNTEYNLIEMGNPKFDGIYNACKKKRYPKGWEKIEGKKTILWTVDHGFYEQSVLHTTFDLYTQTILQYAIVHSEVGFIFRAHPDIWLELIQQGYWTKKDYTEFVRYCEDSQNIVFDQTDTYDNGYSVSDAILADACCGISISALPTGKPIGLTFRSNWEEPMYPQIAECYYKIYGKKQIEAFFEMIINEKDPLRDERALVINNCIKNFDGKNGQRIKQLICSIYEGENPDEITS